MISISKLSKQCVFQIHQNTCSLSFAKFCRSSMSIVHLIRTVTATNRPRNELDDDGWPQQSTPSKPPRWNDKIIGQPSAVGQLRRICISGFRSYPPPPPNHPHITTGPQPHCSLRTNRERCDLQLGYRSVSVYGVSCGWSRLLGQCANTRSQRRSSIYSGGRGGWDTPLFAILSKHKPRSSHETRYSPRLAVCVWGLREGPVAHILHRNVSHVLWSVTHANTSTAAYIYLCRQIAKIDGQTAYARGEHAMRISVIVVSLEPTPMW